MSKKAEAPTQTQDRMPDKPNQSSVTHTAEGKYHALAATQCIRSAAWGYMDNDKVRNTMAEGSLDLYHGLQPRNALESAISMLLVGVTNASLDCLSLAARIHPEELQVRDLNLRHGLRGAEVAAKLAEALETCRGNTPGNVKVGNVKVESGGQAIVGNVQVGKRGRGPVTPECESGKAKDEVA